MVLLPSPSAAFSRLPELQIVPPLSSTAVDSTGTQRVPGESLSPWRTAKEQAFPAHPLCLDQPDNGQEARASAMGHVGRST